MNDPLTETSLDSDLGKALLTELLDSVREVLDGWRAVDVPLLTGPLHLVPERRLTAMETAFDRVVTLIDLGCSGG